MFPPSLGTEGTCITSFEFGVPDRSFTLTETIGILIGALSLDKAGPSVGTGAGVGVGAGVGAGAGAALFVLVFGAVRV